MDSRELAWKIRRHVLEMTHAGHASHVASALSAVDIIAVLYAKILTYDCFDPLMPERDRFILSKGHAGAAVYAALAEVGFFPVENLKKYYMNGSVFSGHVSHKGVPGIEFSTGSLGHGIAMACGTALAARQAKKPYRVYVVTGDGECNEGVVWETALVANQYALSNFTVIVDRNGMQAMGDCEKLMKMEPLAEKWRSFGWNVLDVLDGHDHGQLHEALKESAKDKPTCIIAHTIKGKGISFMERNILWHYRDPQGEFYERAIAELEAGRP